MTSSSRPHADPGTEIVVNGKRVPTKPFVQELIGEAVLAMVGKLKGIDGEVRTVELRVERKH